MFVLVVNLLPIYIFTIKSREKTHEAKQCQVSGFETTTSSAFVCFWLCHAAHGIVAPNQGLNPHHPQRSLDHWAIREVATRIFKTNLPSDKAILLIIYTDKQL